MRRWRSVAAVAALVAIASLAGCVPEQATPVASETATPTVTVATPSPTPTPTASETPPSAAANIPASCDDLGTASSRAETVGNLTAQHADGFVRPSPPNATTKLSCNWIQEEAAAVLIIVSTASDADVSTGLQQLASEGYQCQAAQDFGAQYCMRPGDAATSEDVVVARDDVWIYLETVNVNARAWLSDIAAQIYG
ncbi:MULTISPECIES: hypothetical protein [unclassified Microbacterium]|uniref:hypothetical protein n=1 Tax=unclassified Microbacterium TaxID=2609290 RepID=UPI00097C5FB9|nr:MULTISPECIES: hypothetical protein [unclassified Microbacterium]MDI9892682.1 hypothetical protein [Microbacterium sp. IEGM 1404]ONI64655.1 hypothetical protein CSIV_07915 [Microbacterium sp. CSI-V]